MGWCRLSISQSGSAARDVRRRRVFELGQSYDICGRRRCNQVMVSINSSNSEVLHTDGVCSEIKKTLERMRLERNRNARRGLDSWLRILINGLQDDQRFRSIPALCGEIIEHPIRGSDTGQEVEGS